MKRKNYKPKIMHNGKLVYASQINRKRDRSLTHQHDAGAHWADYRPKKQKFGKYAEAVGNPYSHNGVSKYF